MSKSLEVEGVARVNTDNDLCDGDLMKMGLVSIVSELEFKFSALLWGVFINLLSSSSRAKGLFRFWLTVC